MKPITASHRADVLQMLLPGGGSMGEHIRQFAWQATPLGALKDWPAYLRHAVGMVVNTGFPSLLLCGKEFRCVYNDAFLQTAGPMALPENLLGTTAPEGLDILWPVLEQQVLQVYAHATTWYQEDITVTLAATAPPVCWTICCSPVYNDGGGVAAVWVQCTETTSRVTRFNNLVAQTKSPIAIFKGPQLHVEVANQATLNLWQVGPEVIGRPLAEVLPEMEAQGFTQILRGVMETGQTFLGFEVPGYFIREDGVRDLYYWNFEHSAYTEANGVISGVIALSYDVTQQVESRKKLEQSQQQFQQLANVIPQLVWLTGPDGLANWQNERWKAFFGVNHKNNDWMQQLHPDDVERTNRQWFAAVHQGAPYEIEYRFFDRHTQQYRWFLGKAIAIKNDAGEVMQWFGTCTDIHDQKTLTEKLETLVAERTRALYRSNEDLQQFAHVASHDLKEPIRKVLLFQSRLLDEYVHLLPPVAAGYLHKIGDAARRSFAMINGILFYSSLHNSEEQLVPVPLNRVVADVVADLDELIAQKDALLDVGDLGAVQGLPDLMYHLLYNLVTNALKFARTEVRPAITIRAAVVPPADADNERLPGHHALVRITIRDNGIGFDPIYAERIFGSFTRLHPRDQYDGTGLGLSLCRKIAERMEGTIYATGQPGAGALFTLLLRQP